MLVGTVSQKRGVCRAVGERTRSLRPVCCAWLGLAAWQHLCVARPPLFNGRRNHGGGVAHV